MEDGRDIKDEGWKIYTGWRMEDIYRMEDGRDIKIGGWKRYKGWRMEEI